MISLLPLLIYFLTSAALCLQPELNPRDGRGARGGCSHAASSFVECNCCIFFFFSSRIYRFWVCFQLSLSFDFIFSDDFGTIDLKNYVSHCNISLVQTVHYALCYKNAALNTGRYIYVQREVWMRLGFCSRVHNKEKSSSFIFYLNCWCFSHLIAVTHMLLVFLYIFNERHIDLIVIKSTCLALDLSCYLFLTLHCSTGNLLTGAQWIIHSLGTVVIHS